MLAATELHVPLAEDPHGVIRVGGTRVTLESIVTAWRQGATPEEVAMQFPSVGVDDLYLVFGWVFRNRKAVDNYVQERQALADDTEQKVRHSLGLTDLRDRLQARSDG